MQQVLTWCLQILSHSLMMWVLLSPFTRWGNWSPEKISNLSRVITTGRWPSQNLNAGSLALSLSLLLEGCMWVLLGWQIAFAAIKLYLGQSWKIFKVYRFNRFFQEINISYTKTSSILDTLFYKLVRKKNAATLTRTVLRPVILDDIWMGHINLCGFRISFLY